MRATVVVLLLALVSGAASAQSTDYPSKPIRILVPYGAGATYDINARLYGDWLTKQWGQPVIVENRTGAGGNIAAEAVVKAAPDGYMLLVHGFTVIIQHLLTKSTPFLATRDLTPIADFGGSGSMVIVNAKEVPAKTLGEFVTYVKANPGKINYGNTGSVIPEMELLYQRLGMQMQPILYPSTPASVQALMAGDIQMFLGIPLQAIPLQNEGRGMAIAYTGEKRHPAMPEGPTVAETGLAGNFSWEFWCGLFGPVGLPLAVVAKLHSGALEMEKAPTTLEKFRALGQVPSTLSTEEFRAKTLTLEKTVTDAVTRLGIKPQ